jgi:hypothetical protein
VRQLRVSFPHPCWARLLFALSLLIMAPYVSSRVHQLDVHVCLVCTQCCGQIACIEQAPALCCQLPLPHCRHGPASHYCWWNKYVANPIKAWGYSGKGRTAMRVLKVCFLLPVESVGDTAAGWG